MDLTHIKCILTLTLSETFIESHGVVEGIFALKESELDSNLVQALTWMSKLNSVSNFLSILILLIE